MILSGSLMYSGSIEELPIGAIFFEKDGTLRLMMIDKTDSEDATSVKLINDYFQYALEKNEWLTEFVETSILAARNLEAFKTPHLTLIHGGLSSVTGSLLH